MTRNASPTEDDRVIRASEVGTYSYCARAWWLGSVQGRPPDNADRLEVGRLVHEHHGRQVVIGALLTRLSHLLLVLAGLAGLAWLLSSLVSWLSGAW